ncbi:signal peptidase II [Conyzicola nivalis]|uniref:Lipoprotein signal peptidase n=1 Tax=Conyzicola nivalis TaxID=1477021 RepID=A0A916SMX9_9MICO|nr:signal peptidase II [Conyzicola nivalis]GGB07346.1 lipoprotein signal peptidase [Conyzicola nivalis]
MSTDTPPARTPRRYFWFVLVIALVVIVIDQASKWWAEMALGDGEVIPVIGDLIRFQLVYNPGAAFSIGEGFTWIFTILAAAAVVFIVWYARRASSIGLTLTLGLLLGGAATHLGDRLFRDPAFARGHVVDFIAYGNLFIGNIADIAIFAGAVMLVVLTVRGARADERATPDDAA